MASRSGIGLQPYHRGEDNHRGKRDVFTFYYSLLKV